MDVGIDGPSSLSGFTIRELLREAAGLAVEEDAPDVRRSACEMRDLFAGQGTPRLSLAQVEAYTEVIELAVEYESGVTPYPPDEFATEDDRRSYAVTQHGEELVHAVRWLGGN
jgi:hypothetical protein